MSFNSLSDVVNASTSNISKDALASNLKSFVKRDVGETILASFAPDGQDPLNVLQPQIHTLGALYILSARLNISAPVVAFEYIDNFCSSFESSQARLAPDRVTLLAKGILHLADMGRNPKLAIGPLTALLHRYQPTPGHFTTIHCVLLRACISAECWSHALPLLSTPLTELDKVISDVTYIDNLTYYFLGGVIYGVLKQWQAAEEFFEMAVSAPGSVTSAIQLESFKKLILVQLILYGKPKTLPKYVSGAVSRQLKQPAYQQLVRSYPSSGAVLSMILEKEKATFTADGNIGLIKQAIERAPRWVIRKLTETYLTLSLEDIAKAIGDDVKQAGTPAAIETATYLVLDMIDRGEIHATLTPSNESAALSIVTFSDPPPPMYFDPSILEKIVREAQVQGTQLGIVDREIGMNKSYLYKAVRDKDGGSAQYDEMGDRADYGGRGTGDWD